MIDPTGKILVEIREALADDWTDRVRGGEAAPGDSAVITDPTTDAKKFANRFVVLSRIGAIRMRTIPLQTVLIGVKAYGYTFQDAAALWGAISDAVHNIGPRIGATGIAIYTSADGGSGGALADPTTGQPYEDGTIEVIAGTHVLT